MSICITINENLQTILHKDKQLFCIFQNFNHKIPDNLQPNSCLIFFYIPFINNLVDTSIFFSNNQNIHQT